MDAQFFKRILLYLLLFLLTPFSTFAANSQLPHGYLPLEISNGTLLPDDEVYFVIKALNYHTGQDCFIKIDSSSGIGTCDPVTPDTKSELYNYKLSSLPHFGTSMKRLLLIPKVASGRMYFSIKYPMDLYVSPVSKRIVDPDGFKPRDSNYYTIYDKIEFTYNDAGSWINPTAVDFFSLPIHLSQAGSTSEVKEAGLMGYRQQIINIVKVIFRTFDKTVTKAWSNLFLTYQDKMTGVVTDLRISSPGKAMIAGIPGTKPFDPNYLSNPSVYGFDYVNYLWNYYRTKTLVIDATEIKIFFPLDNYIFIGKTVGDQFVFTNQTGTHTVVVNKPKASWPFFAGAGDSFDAINNTPKAIIIRQLTSAFDVGLLPAPDKTKIDRAYFLSHRNSFYQPNPFLPYTKQGPWSDLYSKALHYFGGREPVYTFAYDDALGQDGTLHDPNAGNLSPVVVTLGNLARTSIPNPYTDPNIYTVMPIIGHGSTVVYNGRPLQSNVPVGNVSIPFRVILNGKQANIYFRPNIVRPFFEGADGIVMNEKGGNNIEVIFPGRAAIAKK